MTYRVALIGGGNMGAALARSFLKSGQLNSDELVVVDRNEEVVQALGAELGCKVSTECSALSPELTLLVLAVKPQGFPAVANDLRGAVPPQATVLSIMAGVSNATISKELGGHERIVRAMPNLPIQVSAGVTGLFSPPEVPSEQIDWIASLLSGSGEVVQVSSEEMIHALTALSASGSGFVFYLMEAFLAEARSFGFDPEQASHIVEGTFAGAVEYLRSSEESAADLRVRVTSKGGTTEAGLRRFEDLAVSDGLREGIRAAFERAKELE